MLTVWPPLYFFPVSPIRLRRVQLWARFGPTLFTTCIPRSSMPSGGPGQRPWTRTPRRETSSFSTFSLTRCFSGHATLPVSFSPWRRTRLCFHMWTLTRNGQSWMRATRRFRQTQTDMAALTSAYCGKYSRAKVWVLPLRTMSMTPLSLPGRNVTSHSFRGTKEDVRM